MVEDLPLDCLSYAISFTSPCDACRSSLASATFRKVADSNLVWGKFLPLDYREIISRSVYPVAFSSNKELFCQLSSTPLLIDEGKMTFSLDRHTCKKCYMLGARELSITWSTNSMYWCWKHLISSRFAEAVELIMVCWLEIHGKINSRMLSANTTYCAYLVFQLAGRAFGLDMRSSEVSIEVGKYKTKRMIYVKRNECMHVSSLHRQDGNSLHSRGDGWLEIELGEFYNHECDKEEIIKMSFSETKGEHLKGGLIVEGIELRPKYC